MLVDRYDPVDMFTQLPGLCLRQDRVLAELDRLLEDEVLFVTLKQDLSRRYPQTRSRGRHSTPVEVLLRMLVVMRLYHWSYEQTEYFVKDSLALRQFCRVYWQPVPDDTTLIKWANLIQPETVARLHERVVALAQQLHVTRGRKLRVDTTVVETNIHHPTDSALLGDGVRVLSRLLRRAKTLASEVPTLAALGKETFRTRTRSCRKLAQAFHRLARQKGEEAAEAMQGAYRRQLAVVQASVRQAQRVQKVLEGQALAGAQKLARQFRHYLPLVTQGIAQTRRRVLEGEVVPAKEKLLSLFEPHTQLITRHKAGKKVEFGRKVWFGEVEGGIVSDYRLLTEGGGTDQPYLEAALDRHEEQFGKAPVLLAGDRGVSSPENERLAQERGAKRVVLPAIGKVTAARRAQEQERWFRRGFNFRAGMEGRLHVLKRDFGLGCCLYHGEAGMSRWIGWGVLTYNLRQIARHRCARAASKG
jgi:IS5 family transposase